MRDCVQPFLDEDDYEWYDDEENNVSVEDILNLEGVEYHASRSLVRDPKPTTATSIPINTTRYEVKISPGLRLLEQHQRDTCR